MRRAQGGAPPVTLFCVQYALSMWLLTCYNIHALSLSLSTSLLITYLSLPGWRLSLHVEFTRVQSIADSCDDWLGLSYMRPQLCFADVILSTQDQTRECHLAEGQKSRTSEHSSLAYLRPHLHVCLHTLMCESILERVVTSS